MTKSIQEFYNDSETRDNVKNYLLDFLKEEAIKKVFEREDTSHIADAKEAIEKAFDNMEYMFAPKEAKKEVINPSR